MFSVTLIHSSTEADPTELSMICDAIQSDPILKKAIPIKSDIDDILNGSKLLQRTLIHFPVFHVKRIQAKETEPIDRREIEKGVFSGNLWFGQKWQDNWIISLLNVNKIFDRIYSYNKMDCPPIVSFDHKRVFYHPTRWSQLTIKKKKPCQDCSKAAITLCDGNKKKQISCNQQDRLVEVTESTYDRMSSSVW